MNNMITAPVTNSLVVLVHFSCQFLWWLDWLYFIAIGPDGFTVQNSQLNELQTSISFGDRFEKSVNTFNVATY